MPIPQLSSKHGAPALFTPHDQLTYFRKQGFVPDFTPPEGVIFCYQRSLLRHIIAQEAPEPLNCVIGRLYPLPSTQHTVAVCADFGIGAPTAAMLLELLIAIGTSRFISIGTAGSLQPDCAIGQVTVCTEAIRDEGVSYHYLPDHPPRVGPTPAITARLADALAMQGVVAQHGPSWTTDAPFRETIAEVMHYQANGVLTVEMEAAALFAVAAVRNVEIAAGFVISDSLATPEWNPQFRAEATDSGLIRLYAAAKAALTQT